MHPEHNASDHHPDTPAEAPAGLHATSPVARPTTDRHTHAPAEAPPYGHRAPAEASAHTQPPTPVAQPETDRHTRASAEAPPSGAPAPAAAAAPTHPTPSAHHPEALVRQFHRTYALPIVEHGPSVDRDRVHMRMALVAEEFAELVGAVYGPTAERTVAQAFSAAVGTDAGTRDVVEAADALGDLVYVIYGMALECGIPLGAVLAQVQASNLSKLGPDGRPIYRADGKVLKGPGYFPPDVAAALGLGSAE